MEMFESHKKNTFLLLSCPAWSFQTSLCSSLWRSAGSCSSHIHEMEMWHLGDELFISGMLEVVFFAHRSTQHSETLWRTQERKRHVTHLSTGDGKHKVILHSVYDLLI